jgi:hypothetical protein
MAQGTRDFLSAWEEFRFEAEEYRELDDERVLVLTGPRWAWQDERCRARADAFNGGGAVPPPRR